MAKQLIGSVQDVCADCGANEPNWVSLNRGVMICDDCCHIHRTLGRHISQVKSIKKSVWRSTQLQMIVDLHRSGANSIWEHTLLDPLTGKTGIKRKPQSKEPLHPNKSEFIRSKYQNLLFINRSANKEESETDISEQLHSSVRTPNLKTSLRLLASGADLNYVHNEKYNCPLHMAAKAGQISQIELLLVYGANPLVIDVKGKTPIDYAKDLKYTDIVERLIESQYELSDRLTYFICQRIPDHKNGQHFLIPEMVESNDRSQESKLKLQSLSNKIFEELSRDVYDEVDRRETDSIFNAIYAANNGQNTDRQVIPFLPVNPHFSSTRNQGRQKLARLNNKEFPQLIVDILFEIRRRLHGMTQTGVTAKTTKSLSTNISHKSVKKGSQNSDSSSDYDSEPLYDSVPSEDEENLFGSEVKITKNSSQNNRSLNPKPSMKVSKSAVTFGEYNLLKDQLSRSDSLIQELVLGNQDMRYEITRLQVMVQKLIDENAQLRAVVIPKSQTPVNTSQEGPPPEILPRNVAKATGRPQSMFNERTPVPTVPAKASSSLNNLQQNITHTNSSFISSLPKENKIISNQNTYHSYNSPIDASLELNDCSVRSTFVSTFPQKEEVLRKTEQITRRIQELLITAQEGRHENFDSCSDKISTAVADMINIFPESFIEISNFPNGERIYSALSQLHSSALKLRVECRTSVNIHSIPQHLQQDFRQMYQKVIESAFEIAKSAKILVTLFQ